MFVEMFLSVANDESSAITFIWKLEYGQTVSENSLCYLFGS